MSKALRSTPGTARNPLSLVRMSLNRLLSFVPLARRLVPQRRDSEGQRASGAFMISLSFNLLTAVWGLMMLVSAVALIVIACFTPGVVFFNTTDARDAEIQSIKSVNDVGLLQQKAIFDISEGSTSSATATYVCHVALWALLFMMIGSIAGLLLVGRIKRHLGTIADDSDPGPARATIELLNRLRGQKAKAKAKGGSDLRFTNCSTAKSAKSAETYRTAREDHRRAGQALAPPVLNSDKLRFKKPQRTVRFTVYDSE